MLNRYNQKHPTKTSHFFLSKYTPNIEESKFLLLKVIEQAIRDYCSIRYMNVPNKDFLWETAYLFLFDDEYVIEWGELNMTLSDIADVLDVDLEWVREKAVEKYKIEKENRLGRKNNKR